MSEIGASLLGAVQGTVSVLLTVFAGFFYARLGLLDKSAVRRVSKLCSSVFLPCLLVVQIGDNLTPELLKSSWIIPVWGAVSTLVAHAVGWAGQVRSSRLHHHPQKQTRRSDCSNCPPGQ